MNTAMNVMNRPRNADSKQVRVDDFAPDTTAIGPMVSIEIAADIFEVLSSDRQLPARSWTIDQSLIDAENNFRARLPELKQAHYGQWAFVSNTNVVGIFDSKDSAEMGAIQKGFCDLTFVVREISEFEEFDH